MEWCVKKMLLVSVPTPGESVPIPLNGQICIIYNIIVSVKRIQLQSSLRAYFHCEGVSAMCLGGWLP